MKQTARYLQICKNSRIIPTTIIHYYKIDVWYVLLDCVQLFEIYSMDGSWDCYVKQNESDRKSLELIWLHSYVEYFFIFGSYSMFLFELVWSSIQTS